MDELKAFGSGQEMTHKKTKSPTVSDLRWEERDELTLAAAKSRDLTTQTGNAASSLAPICSEFGVGERRFVKRGGTHLMKGQPLDRKLGSCQV